MPPPRTRAIAGSPQSRCHHAAASHPSHRWKPVVAPLRAMEAHAHAKPGCPVLPVNPARGQATSPPPASLSGDSEGEERMEAAEFCRHKGSPVSLAGAALDDPLFTRVSSRLYLVLVVCSLIGREQYLHHHSWRSDKRRKGGCSNPKEKERKKWSRHADLFRADHPKGAACRLLWRFSKNPERGGSNAWLCLRKKSRLGKCVCSFPAISPK